MKRNKALNSSTYAFQAGERILVDTNVWLFVQPPAAQPPPGFARQYSAALKAIMAAKATPVVEALIVSEYLNRYFRLEYNVSWTGKYVSFKDFRQSGDFTNVARVAVADATQILGLAAAEDTNFSRADLPGILKETENGTLDFNDGVLVETCRLRGWKLLTNDADMQLGGIEVLTSNPKLLAACP